MCRQFIKKSDTKKGNFSSFSRFCVLAKKKNDFHEELESDIALALPRITSIDSREWIKFLINFLPKLNSVNINELTDGHKRMLRMFEHTIWPTRINDLDINKTIRNLIKLKNNPVMFSEILELLKYNFDHIDFVDETIDLGFDCPLYLHCQYSRDQIMVAFDKHKPKSVMEGVHYVKDKKTDIFMVTLNKASKRYSPSTMYKDYVISEWLFHWQSQNKTTPNSETGQRYINHQKIGSKILLFVRDNANSEAGFTMPYTFLGLADYVHHEGSNPINITWHLQKRIPAKFL